MSAGEYISFGIFVVTFLAAISKVVYTLGQVHQDVKYVKHEVVPEDGRPSIRTEVSDLRRDHEVLRATLVANRVL